jgi:hypothetical protein
MCCSLDTSEKRGDPFLVLLWREGLPKVALGPGGESLDNAGFATFGADHHHGNTFGGFDASEIFKELKTVDSGHIDVTHDEIERSFLDGDKGFGAVSRLENFSKIQACLPE